NDLDRGADPKSGKRATPEWRSVADSDDGKPALQHRPGGSGASGTTLKTASTPGKSDPATAGKKAQGSSNNAWARKGTFDNDSSARGKKTGSRADVVDSAEPSNPRGSKTTAWGGKKATTATKAPTTSKRSTVTTPTRSKRTTSTLNSDLTPRKTTTTTTTPTRTKRSTTTKPTRTKRNAATQPNTTTRSTTTTHTTTQANHTT